MNQFIASARNYIELCKPRVVILMILTSLVGMCLAPADAFPWLAVTVGNLGIAMVASAAAALNHAADEHIDKLMRRTQHRPMAQGNISLRNCLLFSATLCLLGSFLLFYFINPLTALLTFLSLIGYAVCYTLYLKHATPQNIVIGGLAGAAPPLLGWAAVTNSVSPEALILMMIVYVWTPPHFWALAIYRCEDYAKANVPMLPHTHGIPFAKLNILLYTVLLFCVSFLPYVVHMSGIIYLVGMIIANLAFLYYALWLYFFDNDKIAFQTFKYSIHYLGILFLLLLVDHYYFVA